MTPPTTSRTTTRRARIDAIRFGALVRQRLGQSALHRLLPDGRHEITLHGQVFTGTTLAQAIERARALVQGIVTEGCK